MDEQKILLNYTIYFYGLQNRKTLFPNFLLAVENCVNGYKFLSILKSDPICCHYIPFLFVYCTIAI